MLKKATTLKVDNATWQEIKTAIEEGAARFPEPELLPTQTYGVGFQKFSDGVLIQSGKCLFWGVVIAEKKIPASQIKRKTEDFINQWLAKNPGKKRAPKEVREDAKESAIDTLAPKVLPTETMVPVILQDAKDGLYLHVGTCSEKEMESALKPFKGCHADSALSVSMNPLDGQLTDWVLNDDPPSGIELGGSCKLASDEKARIAITNIEHVACSEVHGHIELARQVVEVEVVTDSLIARLNEDRELTSLKLKIEKGSEPEDNYGTILLTADAIHDLHLLIESF